MAQIHRLDPPEGRSLAPHNIDVEQALLGAILVNNEAFDRVSDFLDQAHFYDQVHGMIFNTMADMIRLGKICNAKTLKSVLDASQQIGEIDLAEYLTRLAFEAVTIVNTEEYGRLIFELYRKRKLIWIGEDVVNLAYSPAVEPTAAEQIEEAERALFELAETGATSSKRTLTYAEALTGALEQANAAKNRRSKLAGLSTGIHALDLELGGLAESDLLVIAGRPGMGKTALATNIAWSVASAYRLHEDQAGNRSVADGGRVGFFSLEMSADQLALRIVSAQAELAAWRIRKGEISEPEFDRLLQVAQTGRSAPLHIDETGGINIAQLVTRARRLKRQGKLDLMVVDYIQLIEGSSDRMRYNRVVEITEITTALKALAKELRIPIIALSQLSRQVENREDKRPNLSDLRESGSIEQDADVVMFVYREAYYLNQKKLEPGHVGYDEWLNRVHAAMGKAEVIIAKQRHGPTGTVELHYEDVFTRFSDPGGRPPDPNRNAYEEATR
jgi:replicative DNA helicase